MPSPGRGSKWQRTLRRVKWALVTLGILALAGTAAVAGVFLYYERGLPSVEALRTYRPPQVTKVYCGDGSVCAEYFRERRTWVDIETLPPHVRNAFLAAEDADFYHHDGLDYRGMVRAALKSLLPGGHTTGASTISQQACRNILLSQERTLSRKIREWILTPRMEKALTKDQILALYVNQVDFGHGRYGVEEAALYYFGKHAKDLTIGEAATLAGTVQAPARINPVTNIVKAKKRQQYVLTQLAQHHFLPLAVVDAEMNKPIVLAPRPPDPVGGYYAEEIRRMLQSRYGDDLLLSGGMKVEIAMIPRLQALAEQAVQSGLEALDRRQGYSGPLGKLEPKRFEELKPLIGKRIAEAGKRVKDDELVADLAHLVDQPQEQPEAKSEPADAREEEGTEQKPEENEEGSAAPSRDEVLSRKVALVPVREGLRLAGYVSKVDDGGKRASIELVGRTATMPFASATWARPRGVGKWTASPTRMSDVVHVGDVVLVRVAKVTPGDSPLEVNLDQIPEVQGALLSIDPTNRHVLAMVGGYDFARSPFNRATQAKRQPGSSFKPFLYGAAMATGQYTPVSRVNDAPEPVRDPYTGKVWKPQNYERNGFDGPMTLRQALTESKNTVSVRLIEALTPQVAIDFAKKAGISSPMPDNLTLALGTGEVSMIEIANAYATLQAQGKYSDPITLVRVTDRSGKVLEEHQPAFEETLSPAVSYLVTSLMRSVVERGTATQVRELNRPAAGKTGTASEYRDAWFSGYTMDYVTSAWVGFDDHSPLGSGETGGRAALPLWLSYMKGAEENLPLRDFEIPSGITQVRIDPETGLLAGNAVPGRMEPFLDGTAPTAVTAAPGGVDPGNFLIDDRVRGSR